MRRVFILLTLLGFSYADCPASISMEEAIRVGKSYVGDVISSSRGQNRKTGECYYRIRGRDGTAIIDAKDGKLIRFYRSR
ncbi:MAG: hypothetical protein ACK4SM_05350 [Aquificaceae bacterium]